LILIVNGILSYYLSTWTHPTPSTRARVRPPGVWGRVGAGGTRGLTVSFPSRSHPSTSSSDPASPNASMPRFQADFCISLPACPSLLMVHCLFVIFLGLFLSFLNLVSVAVPLWGRYHLLLHTSISLFPQPSTPCPACCPLVPHPCHAWQNQWPSSVPLPAHLWGPTSVALQHWSVWTFSAFAFTRTCRILAYALSPLCSLALYPSSCCFAVSLLPLSRCHSLSPPSPCTPHTCHRSPHLIHAIRPRRPCPSIAATCFRTTLVAMRIGAPPSPLALTITLTLIRAHLHSPLSLHRCHHGARPPHH